MAEIAVDISVLPVLRLSGLFYLSSHPPSCATANTPKTCRQHTAEPHSLASWRPPGPTSISRRFLERCEAAKKQPFLDTQPLVGHPDCAWANFRQPLLRSCQLPHDIQWRKRLGCGIDGIVWRVNIGQDTFALKVVGIVQYVRVQRANILPVLGKQCPPWETLLGRPKGMPKRGTSADDANRHRDLYRSHPSPSSTKNSPGRCCQFTCILA